MLDGYLEDAQGRMVPRENVKAEHLLEDELVQDLHAEAARLSAELGAFRERALEGVQAFRELIAEQYGAKVGGAKGNVTLTSYDGRLRVVVAIGESLAFGPELQAAKTLIDGCVTRWAEGANANLRALVDQAFQVNKVGRIDTGRVLGLRRLDIEDADWKRAMEAIGDAVRVVASKSYVRFYVREDRGTETWTAVPLDLANAPRAEDAG